MTCERPLLFLEARLSRVVKGIKNTLSCDNRTEILHCRLFPRYHLVRLKVTRKTRSGSENTSKAYKFFAEPGYLHNVKGNEFYQNVIKIRFNWRT